MKQEKHENRENKRKCLEEDGVGVEVDGGEDGAAELGQDLRGEVREGVESSHGLIEGVKIRPGRVGLGKRTLAETRTTEKN